MNKFRMISLLATLLVLTQVTYAKSKKVEAEFSETKVLIEINASDGDVGFHAKYDADAWWKVYMWNPKGKKILKEMERKRNGISSGRQNEIGHRIHGIRIFRFLGYSSPNFS